MLKPLTFLLCILLSAASSFGQYFFYDDKYLDNDLLWEAGLSLGLMNSVTDVGERKGHGLSPSYYDWKSSRFNFSVYGGILYKSVVEGRLEFTKGSIAGKDANSNSAYVRDRNLNYRTSITELSFIAGFHPITLFNIDHLPKLSPYVMAGIGVFSFYPKTLYNGELIPLRRMNTEGQTSDRYPARKQYNLRSVSTPVGLGLKYEFNAKFNFRLEGLYRFTSTDYLDDASTTYVPRDVFDNDLSRILAHRYKEVTPWIERTGQPRAKVLNKDKFFSINLRVGYVIGRERKR